MSAVLDRPALARAQAVVFDMDGTLVDTEPLYRRVFLATAAEFAVAMDDGLPDCLIGLSSRDRAPLLAAAFGPDFPVIAFFAAYRLRKAASLRDGVPVMPGAHALLATLRRAGIQCAVATSATRRTANDILGRSGLLNYLDAVITRDDVVRGKPDPQTHCLAAAALGRPPRTCLALEDSAPGLAAATAAGLIAVQVGPLPAVPCLLRLDRLDDLRAHVPQWQLCAGKKA